MKKKKRRVRKPEPFFIPEGGEVARCVDEPTEDVGKHTDDKSDYRHVVFIDDTCIYTPQTFRSLGRWLARAAAWCEDDQ